MTDDDDQLTGIDLSAWEPPPPAGGLADAVIARMREPVRAAALEPGERGARRWWILGGVAAMVAVVAVIATGGLARAPASGRGELVAVRPAHLDLGPSSAVLDPGADVRWERSRHRLHATQARGGATWRVGGDDTIVIDAGATVASVEATGASLRVEVQMNPFETRSGEVQDGGARSARILGASAVTAAAIAMVTVIVYEGHVKVSGAGQTVHVAPGTTIEVRPEQPPREVIHVGASGDDASELADARAEIARLEKELEEARRSGGSVGIDPFDPPVPTTPEKDRTVSAATCDEVSCVLSNYDGTCCEKSKKPKPPPAERRSDDGQPDSLDRAMISEGVSRIKSEVMACSDGSYEGLIKVSVKVGASGGVTNVSIKDGDAKVGKCVIDVFRTARFAPTRNGGSFSYPFLFSRTACDADKLKEKAQKAFASGSYTVAHNHFEAAYACRREALVAMKAFISACNLRNVPKAKRWWKAMPETMKTSAAVPCIRNGIMREQLDETCDTLADQGKDAFTSGNYDAAHEKFQTAYRCKADPLIAQKALISACKLRSVGKAKRWWKLLPAQMQTQLLPACVRNGIARDDLE